MKLKILIKWFNIHYRGGLILHYKREWFVYILSINKYKFNINISR